MINHLNHPHRIPKCVCRVPKLMLPGRLLCGLIALPVYFCPTCHYTMFFTKFQRTLFNFILRHWFNGEVLSYNNEQEAS